MDTYKITVRQFTKHTGHKPVNDDIARANCDKAGEIGHMACGWCYEHHLPYTQHNCRSINNG